MRTAIGSLVGIIVLVAGAPLRRWAVEAAETHRRKAVAWREVDPPAPQLNAQTETLRGHCPLSIFQNFQISRRRWKNSSIDPTLILLTFLMLIM
jgi:hypothetical protein